MEREAAKEKEEKIDEYRRLLDAAHRLFDGRYTQQYLGESLSYKDLLSIMEREHQRLEKMSKEEQESEAAQKMNREIAKISR